MRVLLVSANREKLPSPVVPIGILYIAAALRDEHDVRMLDLCFEDRPLDCLAQMIRDGRPDVVGLGLRNLSDSAYGPTDLIAEYAAMARTIRDHTRGLLVIGGAAVTLQPTAVVEALRPDHAVVGEGELALQALLARAARGERGDRIVASEVAGVDGAALLRGRRRRSATRTLDDLAPPWRELIDPRYFEAEGTDAVQTKRGCAFACTYCDYPDLEGRKVRSRNPELVANEIVRTGLRPGVSHVFIVDSIFNVPRSHALAVCEALRRRGSSVPWVCYVSPATFDSELAAAMAGAGCVGVEVGTDAGSAAVLERLRKPFGLAQVRRARRAARDASIADCHTFVLGAENETEAETEETLRFVPDLDPDVAVFVVYTEDREARAGTVAPRRAAILARLAHEARKRPNWVVPELGIRHDARISLALRRRGVRGPPWLALAAMRARSQRTS